ncbi:Rap1a/Tai family immunity protein [Novosphingobium sp. ERN07]|uniref:Rap1a/Tai family immunity protein n=1 Tax=Novosphingobium sp. ERN07 TaxID=2726187 RepID=UPI001980F00B|nr:Rap1a/Tai family immunity protein [Novosphingobium sp. ERN07]
MIARRLPLAMLLLAATPAHAEWMSAQQLHETCTTAAPVDRAMCLSYVIGVLDGFRDLDRPPKTPLDTSAGQVRDVVVRYLDEHPEQRTLQGREVIRAAIVAEWPKLQPAKPKPQPKPRKKRR